MKEKYMEIALNQATKAYKKGEIPVGAVVVEKNKVIAKAYNKRHKSKNVLDHAEIIAIKKATKKKNDWRLDECDLYVTLEPCDMCKEVIKAARIKTIYYSLPSLKEKSSNKNTRFVVFSEYSHLAHALLKNFFESKRK